jgi:ABC-type Fe3+/spermidine/putrescine transport system ATPase subunit
MAIARTEPAAPRRQQRVDVPVVEFKDVTKVYDGGSVAVQAASMRIERGAFVFLVGPTGCGKSTCIRLMM